MDIESPEVQNILHELISNESKIAPWSVSELSLDEIWHQTNVIWLEAYQKLIDVGYLRELEDVEYAPWNTTYKDMLAECRSGSLSRESLGVWCKGTGQPEIMQCFVRSHQRQFGEAEVGYQPSPRLVAGRVALAKYASAHAKLSKAELLQDPTVAHAKIMQQLEQEVLAVGWESMADFLRVAQDVLY